MLERTKIVDFEGYCKRCKYFEKEENEDPCWNCLCDGVNYNTKRPTKFEEENKE